MYRATFERADGSFGYCEAPTKEQASFQAEREARRRMTPLTRNVASDEEEPLELPHSIGGSLDRFVHTTPQPFPDDAYPTKPQPSYMGAFTMNDNEQEPLLLPSMSESTSSERSAVTNQARLVPSSLAPGEEEPLLLPTMTFEDRLAKPALNMSMQRASARNEEEALPLPQWNG